MITRTPSAAVFYASVLLAQFFLLQPGYCGAQARQAAQARQPAQTRQMAQARQIAQTRQAAQDPQPARQAAPYPQAAPERQPLSADEKPRVIISTDIGGTDPDDFQSMIHYLMYADRFDTRGIISSPYGPGRKQDVLDMIDLYEKDYQRLSAHSPDFPRAGELRQLVKQGAIDQAPFKGWSEPTEGSRWIIRQARASDSRPLWVLVWGGLEDLAQALHDAPEIASRLRVHWIGGPNKKWSVNAYLYIVKNFPRLWMIESNASYRGWFAEPDLPGEWSNEGFFKHHIAGAGYMGADFVNYYEGSIKMGDSPTVGHLLHGNAEAPEEPGWGGRFVPLPYSARRIYRRNTTLADTVPVYSVVQWEINGPEAGLDEGTPCLDVTIAGQHFQGYYLGGGRYVARFVPKAAGSWSYRISSDIDGWETASGELVSAGPWPGPAHDDNISGLRGWWSDDPAPRLFIDGWQGAYTVARWRKQWMADWAERWSWLRGKENE